MKRLRTAGSAAFAALALAFAALISSSPALGAEVPGAGTFYIQTDGPNTAVSRGDWYTSTAAGAGAGYHYVEFSVGCDWPSTAPVVVDLFSPEIVASVAVASGGDEEYSGAYDSTEFELYGPNVSPGPGFASPAPGGGFVNTTYAPKLAGPEAWVNFATLPAPVACGTYTLRAETGDNDQNGWRVRVGEDDDSNILTAPIDNADGVAGTNDEIILGLAQTSYQQTSGAAQCFTLWEYIPPGQASVAVNNFDYDGYDFPSGAEVTYTSPSGAITIGTVSATDATWNGSNTITRGGDILTNPESGWWQFTSCMASNNQFVQEAVQNTPSYVTQPPTPDLTVVKTDGQTTVARGQSLTYAITASNIASGSAAGAATSVHIEDTLPPGVTFVSCAFVAPATGSCTQAAGLVSADLTGALNAGADAELQVVATVGALATGTQTNTVTVDYEDSFGNVFPQETASDVDTIPAGTGVIGDLVFLDSDGDSVRDSGEPGLNNVTVTLTGPGGVTTVTTTDSSGLYSFTGLYAGSYTVAVTAGTPAGTSGSLGSTGYSLVLASGATDNTNDFGFTGGASIGDLVWLDRNGDGTFDPGETGIGGVDVVVTWAGPDTTFGTGDDVDYVATTAVDGSYLVAGLPSGDVRVAVDASTVPAGVSSTTSGLLTFTLVPSQVVTTADFGYVGQGSIGSLVWVDTDGDNTMDAGESPLPNVDLTLTWVGFDGVASTSDDVVATTTTDSGGLYLFDGLPPGTYLVSVVGSTVPPTLLLVSGLATNSIDLTALAPDRLDVNLGYQALNVLGLTGSETGGILGVAIGTLVLGLLLTWFAPRRRSGAAAARG